MLLNYIWIGFIFIAFVVAVLRLLIGGDTEVFNAIMLSTFDSARTGFEVSIGLTGVLSLWLGLMKIGERAGLTERLARFAAPVFCRLFPQLPREHPAAGTIFLNFSANLLGLDNAATPIGLKAMQQLQSLNDKKDTASNSMIMFLNINASGLTIIPITIMMYRMQFNAANPADVFLPILITTFITTLVAITLVCIVQKINIFQRSLLLFFGCFIAFIVVLLIVFRSLPSDKISLYSSLTANVLLFTVICGFLLAGFRKKLNVYDTFIEGAKQGFFTAVKIIPYLVAILVAIGVFRASGAMDYLFDGIRWAAAACGLDTSFVEGLPTLFMKPLSGSGSRGLMLDAMKTYGADSFVGRLACIGQGTTDTIFYIAAVYFGSVGIRNTRHTIPCALIADLCGAIAAIAICYLFFF
jgi:spore maturation protein SpmA/spore maturation protein SpmB